MAGVDPLLPIAQAIASGDRARVRLARGAAKQAFRVGAARTGAESYWLAPIGHYVYAGDTLLHVAAAAYDLPVARALLAAGADVRARNRRGAEPLHYAVDGAPGSERWSPRAQAALVALLVAHGADPDALDADGVAPLHRAVRTRCTGAVRALLEAGAEPTRVSGRGSMPMDLATKTTGRGGSGTEAARREQAAILVLLRDALAGRPRA